MNIQHFFDPITATLSYVVSDPKTNKAAIIDPVLDYDPDSAEVSTTSADKIIDYVIKNGFEIEWILETHIHADHLSSAKCLKEKLGGKIAIGSNITLIHELWGPLFDIEDDIPAHPFDHIFNEGDTFNIGTLTGKVIFTPGHTPASYSYLIEDSVFVGDTLFAPPRGTARADFPAGDARELYRSIHTLYQLPDETKVYLCHDYPPAGQEPIFQSTIREQKETNAMIREGISEDEYVEKREARDKVLTTPRLLLPSIQYNMRGSSFGRVHKNGRQYLQIPINAFKESNNDARTCTDPS